MRDIKSGINIKKSSALSNLNICLNGNGAFMNDIDSNELILNIEKLHTTNLGVMRIKKNLSLDTDEVADWCKSKIKSDGACITRNGKNWYINVDSCIITVNANSYTIITAHKEKK